MSTRFYHATPIAAERVTLDGPEAHHLLHVGRAVAGQGVTLFDGSGAEYAAVIEKLGRRAVELRIVERIDANRELPYTLTFGVALPKGDRQRWLVEILHRAALNREGVRSLGSHSGARDPNAGALC